MDPLKSTLAALTEQQLVNFAKQHMPTPPPALMKPNTGDQNYMKILDQIQAEGEIYGGGIDGHLAGLNNSILNRFAGAAHEFAEHKDTVPVPEFPTFYYFDQPAFDQWEALSFSTDDQSSPNYGNTQLVDWLAANQFYRKPAPKIPAVIILPPGSDQPPPPPPATDGPIGVEANPGVFRPSALDTFPDGYLYAGPTGVYQKHVYHEFGTGELKAIWLQLQALTPTPAPPAPTPAPSAPSAPTTQQPPVSEMISASRGGSGSD